MSPVMAAGSHHFVFGWPLALKHQATHPVARLHVILHGVLLFLVIELSFIN